MRIPVHSRRREFLRLRLCDTLVLLVAASFLCTCGCMNCQTENEPDSAEVLRNVVERGPLSVVTEVSPAQPRLSDEPTFTLTYEYEEGVVVNKPPFGKALGEFEILSFREPPATRAGSRQVEQQIYRLEPTTAGDLKIAPIKITFRDGRKDVGDQQQHELTTEEIVVPVTTMLDDEAPSLSDLRPAAPPVRLPMQFGYKWLAWLAVPLLLVAASLYWWRWRKSQLPPEPIYTPREIATAALRELERSNMAQKDVKTFYVELTGIVRRYLEQTSGVHAPEQTTEEFLRAIADHDAFLGEKRERLQQFLESADLVKFAGHQPSTEDVDQAFQRARRFIEITWSPPAQEIAA